jgi:peptidoglycan/xylan/chitin deacetylase (PgdA/CDA1 family)
MAAAPTSSPHRRLPLRELAARRSLILAYHGVGPSLSADDPNFLRVPADRFRAQVESLLHAGFELVTVAELAARADGGEPPPGLAAISFDDGMEDNHSAALPILRELGAPATVYVTTGLLGQQNPWIAYDARMMTRDELLDLHVAGWELGAHTVTHPDLSALSREDCVRELSESRAMLEELTGAPVRTFAYPFCKYGPEALAAVAEVGFEAAVTCHGRGGWSRHEMKRQMITGKDGYASFVLKAWELYGPLFDSPPGRLARDTTRGARRRARVLLERRGG